MDALVIACRLAGLPIPETEYCAIPGRRFRCDYAWPAAKLSLEVQGGIWNRGKHGRGSGIVRDMEKANLMAVQGWRCLYIEPKHRADLRTLTLIREALAA